MRAVIQRCGAARVRVDTAVTGSIPHGLIAYVGFRHGDDEHDLTYVAQKIAHLRVFEDEADRMNRSLLDLLQSESSPENPAGLLIVSQFTLYGDVRKGRRPSYNRAAPPEEANNLYGRFVSIAKELIPNVAGGVFQAKMDVEYVNRGPVTILVDSEKTF